MSRGRRLVLIGLAAALMVIATLPLALVARQLALPGLAADEATGSLWHGRLRGAQVGGRHFGDVAAALRPLPLLLGERQFQLDGSSWSARLVRGERNGILSAEGLLPPSALSTLDGAMLEVSLRQARLLFKEGECVDAAGQVLAVLQWQDASLPELRLQGLLECAGGVGRMTLSNGNEGPFPVQLSATVSGDGSYRLQANAQPGDPAAHAALVLAGFEETPSGLGQSMEGSLFR